jgi:hypothetical protein
MARVPIATNVVPLASPGVSARVEAPNMGAGGEMIGRSLRGLGQDLGEAAQQQEEVLQIHDHAAVKEAVNNVLNWYTGAAYTGPDAFFTKDGRNAVEGQPRLQKGLDTLIAEQRQSLHNPQQQRMFDLAMTPQRDSWSITIADHANREVKAYDKDQSAALQDGASELAKAQYLNDPAGAEKQIDTGLSEVERYWRSQGAPEDVIATQKLKYTSGIYKDVGANLAYSGPDGPKLAQALLDQHGASMTADDRYAVATHVRVSQNSIDAEARQVEADQRRLVAEAKSEARVRAQSASGLLDSGLPMDPKTYASAISDAQTAEDVGLLKKLQDGQLKNTTLFAHQHDTPLQLQNEVNALSADIAKAGEKADPNKIIQRDALQQLYTNSAEQLRTNGVGWLAQHQGADPQPLNIFDPASIQARVSLVQQGRRQTGTNIAPLQPAEVAQYGQAWKTGDAQTKTNMVMRLSQFGGLSSDVADQIAPGDNGLVHLIDLGSHSNRGVAMSRVSQAIAGYEAMKTEGDIVGKLASSAQGQSQFNEWTGSALQFMPGARDGVFTTAKALLAEDAASHGWVDDTAADTKAWYRAVNSALGAYTRGSVQYGGLAGFNGAQTVLPENMSLADFEGRVARASGPQMRAAANGLPILADGTPLHAGDLKKMHFVPVGDGIYRLENGGSFVHTKDGPFEIDVRKLPDGAAQPAGRAGGQTPFLATPSRPAGMIAPGNIDLRHRPVIHNDDGSISTVRSITVTDDRGAVLIPTVIGNKVVSNKEAIGHYRQTGEHLGIFKTEAQANAYAKSLHEQQAQEYDFDAQLAAHGYSRF